MQNSAERESAKLPVATVASFDEERSTESTERNSLNEDFLGGPPQLFDPAGREQLMILLEHGLTFMLTSFFPAKLFGRRDYQGKRWVGRSHESEEQGVIAHDFGWIQRVSHQRGLVAQRLERLPLEAGGQIWAAITKKS